MERFLIKELRVYAVRCWKHCSFPNLKLTAFCIKMRKQKLSS